MHPKKHALVLCPIPPDARNSRSRAEREQDARDYWDRLTPAHEAWVLTKMRLAQMGDLS